MNIKKEVAKNIEKFIREELNKVNNKIHDNKYKFARLTEEQTILKRERVKIHELLNTIRRDAR